VRPSRLTLIAARILSPTANGMVPTKAAAAMLCLPATFMPPVAATAILCLAPNGMPFPALNGMLPTKAISMLALTTS